MLEKLASIYNLKQKKIIKRLVHKRFIAKIYKLYNV
jgi:hypothetical protein